MNKKGDPENYSPQETDARLGAMLRGAFSASPTPLKAIPKKNGEKRAGARKASPRRKG